MEKTLQELEPSEEGFIQSIDSTYFSPEQISTLMDYGFLPRAKVSVFYKLPSQDKLIVRLGSYDIAIRYSDAKHIRLTL